VRLRYKLRQQKNWLLHHDNALSHVFTGEFLTKNNMTVILHPPYFSVSLIEEKLKSHHFNTTEVIEV
jgi:hypothetical protein